MKTVLTYNNRIKYKTTHISHVHIKQIKTQKKVSIEILKKMLNFLERDLCTLVMVSRNKILVGQ